ncbi:MAG: SDR family oxidoreductase [Verrucomicrobia bacterium]|nr:SDR family oxidoreductase [Verrucomicrobiota bacterium]
MNKTAVVTGGGSGVGQAIALKLAQQGWRVAIIGRRAETLQETIRLAGIHAAQITHHVCDVGDASAVATTGKLILSEFGEVELLVNAAGTNAPRRSLEVLSFEDYHAMIATNLHGAYYCVQAFLPRMRAQKSGTIINIISDAGKQASPKAGPGYVMSKFGLAGLTQSMNAEERANGIRACAIFPGDIDTPLLNKRPQVPDATVRAKMMRAEDVADCALFCINLPSHVIVEEMLVRPR